MQLFGGILILLSVLALLGAGVNAENAPNSAYLIGTFLPGLFLLLVGLSLNRAKSPRTVNPSTEDVAEEPKRSLKARARSFESRTNWGVASGILLMFASSSAARSDPEWFLTSLAGFAGGWALLLWGCVNYTRWKGYSGWLGLFGYLFLPGLIVLACLPNRRKRLLRGGSENLADLNDLGRRDRRSGLRYLPTIIPLGLLFASAAAFLSFPLANIDPSEWRPIDPVGGGFQALAPGTPRVEEEARETPAGTVEVRKFIVEPKGKKELFMIVAIRFPDAVGEQLGGREKLLELGRKDLLAASQGRIQNERPIVSGGLPGLELELLPPAGASVKARLYATKTRLYQVMVHVPRIRLHSTDVQKYLDSFRMSSPPDAEAGPDAK